MLTLIIVTDDGPAEEQIRAGNDASREHPCRIIAVVRGNRRGTSRLDAQVRVGGDAGASEVLVLRLWGPLVDHGDSVVVPFLLPDAPVVAWWPGTPPDKPSEDPIGRMAQRRITDAAATSNPMKTLERSARWHVPGDTDLAWSRITLWRGLLAAAFDQPPHDPVTAGAVTGGSDSPSAELMAAWLAWTLRCPVTRTRTQAGQRPDQRRPGARVGAGRARPARGQQRRHPDPARSARAPRLAAAAVGPGLPGGGAPPAGPGRDLRRGAHGGAQAAAREGGDKSGRAEAAKPAKRTVTRRRPR